MRLRNAQNQLVEPMVSINTTRSQLTAAAAALESSHRRDGSRVDIRRDLNKRLELRRLKEAYLSALRSREDSRATLTSSAGRVLPQLAGSLGESPFIVAAACGGAHSPSFPHRPHPPSALPTAAGGGTPSLVDDQFGGTLKGAVLRLEAYNPTPRYKLGKQGINEDINLLLQERLSQLRVSASSALADLQPALAFAALDDVIAGADGVLAELLSAIRVELTRSVYAPAAASSFTLPPQRRQQQWGPATTNAYRDDDMAVPVSRSMSSTSSVGCCPVTNPKGMAATVSVTVTRPPVAAQPRPTTTVVCGEPAAAAVETRGAEEPSRLLVNGPSPRGDDDDLLLWHPPAAAGLTFVDRVRELERELSAAQAIIEELQLSREAHDAVADVRVQQASMSEKFQSEQTTLQGSLLAECRKLRTQLREANLATRDAAAEARYYSAQSVELQRNLKATFDRLYELATQQHVAMRGGAGEVRFERSRKDATPLEKIVAESNEDILKVLSMPFTHLGPRDVAPDVAAAAGDATVEAARAAAVDHQPSGEEEGASSSSPLGSLITSPALRVVSPAGVLMSNEGGSAPTSNRESPPPCKRAQ